MCVVGVCVCVLRERSEQKKCYFLENKEFHHGSYYFGISNQTQEDCVLSGILFFILINTESGSSFYSLMEYLNCLKHIILLTPQKRES